MFSSSQSGSIAGIAAAQVGIQVQVAAQVQVATQVGIQDAWTRQNVPELKINLLG